MCKDHPSFAVTEAVFQIRKRWILLGDFPEKQGWAVPHSQVEVVSLSVWEAASLNRLEVVSGFSQSPLTASTPTQECMGGGWEEKNSSKFLLLSLTLPKLCTCLLPDSPLASEQMD